MSKIDLSGKSPSKNWVKWFLQCNEDHIQFSHTSALNPKHTKSFNYPVVKDYFEKLGEVIRKYNIPIENIYNMDEKGCQLGGSRKQGHHKYLFGKNSHLCYQTKDANLKLVMIVECVCADGAVLKLYIIFKGGFRRIGTEQGELRKRQREPPLQWICHGADYNMGLGWPFLKMAG